MASRRQVRCGIDRQADRRKALANSTNQVFHHSRESRLHHGVHVLAHRQVLCPHTHTGRGCLRRAVPRASRASIEKWAIVLFTVAPRLIEQVGLLGRIFFCSLVLTSAPRGATAERRPTAPDRWLHCCSSSTIGRSWLAHRLLLLPSSASANKPSFPSLRRLCTLHCFDPRAASRCLPTMTSQLLGLRSRHKSCRIMPSGNG